MYLYLIFIDTINERQLKTNFYKFYFEHKNLLQKLMKFVRNQFFHNKIQINNDNLKSTWKIIILNLPLKKCLLNKYLTNLTIKLLINVLLSILLISILLILICKLSLK